MTSEVKKYLWDILQAIERLELASTKISFEDFSSDVLRINAVERNFEIIGEALKRIVNLHPEIQITDYPKIIGMRNIIAHNYDGVEPVTLWGTIKKNIPVLKEEVLTLLNKD
jgi:uncharacterized protein with HEPN domain